MNAYLQLALVSLLPIIAAILILKFDEHQIFGDMKKPANQLAIGIVFGCIAILGTEWGVPLNGAQVNCRDAAVLTAGLMFGGPAGIIAGTMGAVERWFSVYWGVGEYTRIACTVATFVAGIYAALLRKYMFEGKRPWWLIALAIGCVMEVFHITMVFLTHLDEPYQAIAVVNSCTIPLVAANSLSLGLCAMIMSLITGGRIRITKGTRTVTEIIQKWLMVIIMIAFVLTSVFVYEVQDGMAEEQTRNQLKNVLSEAYAVLCVGTPETVICNDIKAGETGFTYILDDKGNVIAVTHGTPNPGKMSVEKLNYDAVSEMTVDDETCLVLMEKHATHILIAGIPKKDAVGLRNIAVYVNTFMEILAFAILFAFLFFVIKHVIVNGIRKINRSLRRITEGNLEEVVNVDSSSEFKGLSDDINSTVAALKGYIAEAEDRIDQELQFAKDIQYSSLPALTEKIRKRADMDIFADMVTAKEVGGDFYDFYFTGPDRITFLIADVSGKGVPAAMFMMRAKTELRAMTENMEIPCEAFEAANNALCDGNDAGMFVTAWQGSVNLETGEMQFANAGHNPPLLKKAGGRFEYIEQKKGFVLAGMDEMMYKPQTLQLEPGDIIYLYTDGVTEAARENGELYGEARLRGALNEAGDVSAEELCQYIREDVDAFADGAAQFDDITMLAFKFQGKAPEARIDFENAKTEDIIEITAFVEEQLEKMDLSQKDIIHFSIAIDEIYSNIVKYAYGEGSGPASVIVREVEEPHAVEISFVDNGTPHNPLTKEKPDITLSAEDRPMGGLGIFITREIMDDMKYRYEKEQNILSIYKEIG